MTKLAALLLGLPFPALCLAACSGTPVQPTDAGDQPAKCGGFAGLKCPPGLFCQDDPTDQCDPTHGGNDCIGICVINPVGGAATSGAPGSSTATETGTSPGASTACGKNVCTASQYCCNESCGICAPKGGYCTQQYCD